MAELNGAMLHNLELKIGWGKAVQLPPEALYTATNMAAGGAPRGVAVPPPGAEAAPPWADPHAAEPASSGAPSVVSSSRTCLLLHACVRFRWLAHRAALECRPTGEARPAANRAEPASRGASRSMVALLLLNACQDMKRQIWAGLAHHYQHGRQCRSARHCILAAGGSGCLALGWHAAEPAISCIQHIMRNDSLLHT